MFCHDKRLQRPVKVEPADPAFARMLQQAIGGAEGEIRAGMQHPCRCRGSRRPNPKRRDMPMHAVTEEGAFRRAALGRVGLIGKLPWMDPS